MFLTDSEAEARLQSPKNLARVEPMFRGGKTTGSQIPEEIRLLAALTAQTEGSKVAAEEFGITQVTANTLSKGRRSPGVPAPDFQEKLDTLTGTVREDVMDKLMQSLDCVDIQSGMADLKLTGQVSVIEKLASVIDRLSPRGAEVQVQQNAFIVYSPPAPKVDFEVLTAPIPV